MTEVLKNVKPDLLVLDLYHTIPQANGLDVDEINKRVEDKLCEVNTILLQLKKIVDDGKNPRALEILRRIRAIPRFENLPVMLYTRQGLSLLEDNQLEEASKLGAHWMMKGRSLSFEKGTMLNFIDEQKRLHRRLKRDVILTIVGILGGVLLSLLVNLIFKQV